MPRTVTLSSNVPLAVLVAWVVKHNDWVVIQNRGQRLAVLQSARTARQHQQDRTCQMKRNLLKRLAEIRRRNRSLKPVATG
jgi:hypothetical protein